MDFFANAGETCQNDEYEIVGEQLRRLNYTHSFHPSSLNLVKTILSDALLAVKSFDVTKESLIATENKFKQQVNRSATLETTLNKALMESQDALGNLQRLEEEKDRQLSRQQTQLFATQQELDGWIEALRKEREQHEIQIAALRAELDALQDRLRESCEKVDYLQGENQKVQFKQILHLAVVISCCKL